MNGKSTLDVFIDYFAVRPRQLLQFLILVFLLILNVPAFFLCLIFFFIFSISKIGIKEDKPTQGYYFLAILMVLLMMIFHYHFKGFPLKIVGKTLIHDNFIFVQEVFKYNSKSHVLNHSMNHSNYFKNYFHILKLPIFLLSLIFSIVLHLSHFIPNLKTVDEGIKRRVEEEKLKKIAKDNEKIQSVPLSDGTLVGKVGSKNLVVSDKQLNTQIIIFGTNGSGKTVLMKRFYRRAIKEGYPLIVITAKPDRLDAEFLRKYSEEHERNFYSFDIENFDKFDLFSTGTPTQVMEKIINLQENWANEYYKDVAKNVVLNCIKLLRYESQSEKIDLKELLKLMKVETFILRAKDTQNKEIIETFSDLRALKNEDLTGVKSLLQTLINGDFAEHFSPGGITFKEILETNSICYFALDNFKAKELIKQIGIIAVLESKLSLALLDEERKKNRYFLMFDEFRDFCTDHAVDLMNKGRSKGAHVFLASQSLDDFGDLAGALIDNANTIFSFRVNHGESAENIAVYAGTKISIKSTDRVSVGVRTGETSQRVVNEFRVSPDTLKYLDRGECIYISKEFNKVQKVKVLYEDEQDFKRLNIDF